MRIIVSDSSCLIDLKKASLLGVFLSLPYEILIPNTLFEDELLSFTAADKRMLLQGGLQVVDLPGQQVLRARDVITSRPRLSVHDGFAYARAESRTDSILLTGDGQLRALATSNKIEVHALHREKAPLPVPAVVPIPTHAPDGLFGPPCVQQRSQANE
jgi:hypothetical protein